jgi:cell division protein FtsQ
VIDYKNIDKEETGKRKSYSLKTVWAFFVLFFLLVFVFLSIYLYTLFTREHYILRYVAISGNHVLSADAIKSITLTNKATCINNHNEEDIYSGLIINPWVKRAYVAKIYPDTIYIKILERKPFGLVEFNDKAFIIDKDGSVIDIYKKGMNVDISNLPAIMVNNKSYINKPYLMKAILDIYLKLDKLGKINYIEVISDSRQLVHFSNALNVVVDSLHCPSSAFIHLEKAWLNLVRKRKRLDSVSICFSDKFVLKWKKEKKGE